MNRQDAWTALGTTRKGLAEHFGIRPESVSRWEEVPSYVEAYVSLFQQYQKVTGVRSIHELPEKDMG